MSVTKAEASLMELVIQNRFDHVDDRSLDDAIAWAKKCPGVATGTIELRPVMVFET